MFRNFIFSLMVVITSFLWRTERLARAMIQVKPWRRRMTNYISEENAAYTKLMEWARIQKDVINEKPHVFGE